MTESGMLARVIFDEAHSEAWTVRAELAHQMQPAHPGDASYARAAATLAERDFVVEVHADGPLTPDALSGAGVLVIAHPSDPIWERTTGSGSPRLSEDELDAIEAFVAGGGGLIVLGETEQEKYGNNVNELLDRFGLHLENDTVQDFEHFHSAPTWILAELRRGGRGRGGDLLARVNAVCLYRATTISATQRRACARPHARVRIGSRRAADRRLRARRRPRRRARRLRPVRRRLHRRARPPRAVAQPRLLGGPPARTARRIWPVRGHRDGHGPEHDPEWARLRDETNALALLQAPDGSLARDADAARGHVEAIASAIEQLDPGSLTKPGI